MGDALEQDDPFGTPSGLADSDATTTLVLDSLATAVQGLTDAGIALDAPLGDVQVDARIGGSAPVPGTGWDDSPNIATCCGTNSSLLAPASDVDRDTYRRYTSDGTMPILYGASFVMALEFTPDGPSSPQAVLTYGQADDPDDPELRVTDGALGPDVDAADPVRAGPGRSGRPRRAAHRERSAFLTAALHALTRH